MRVMTAIAITATAVTMAAAEDNASASRHSIGETYLPSHQHTSGGAPASPPGMQAAPEGSSKTIVDKP